MDGDDRKDGEMKALGSLTTSSREPFGFSLSMDVIMVIASNGVSFALDRLEALGGELIEWMETIARMEK